MTDAPLLALAHNVEIRSPSRDGEESLEISTSAPQQREAVDQPGPDWAWIEREFRSTSRSVREIAKDSGVSHTAINKRATAECWSRLVSTTVSSQVSTSAFTAAETSTAGDMLAKANATVETILARAEPKPEPEPTFDWEAARERAELIAERQDALAVYRTQRDQIAIRTEATFEEEDPCIVIDPRHVDEVIAQLKRVRDEIRADT